MLALCHKIGCLCLKVSQDWLPVSKSVKSLFSHHDGYQFVFYNVVGQQRIITFVLIDTILPKICICLFKKHDYLSLKSVLCFF